MEKDDFPFDEKQLRCRHSSDEAARRKGRTSPRQSYSVEMGNDETVVVALVEELIPDVSDVQEISSKQSMDKLSATTDVHQILLDLKESPTKQRIDSDSNQLTGKISESIVELTNLNWLSLQENRLSGKVPELPNNPEVNLNCFLDECFTDMHHSRLMKCITFSKC